MATKSVTAENLPAHKYTGNSCGFDVSDPSEKARYALSGAEAISVIIQDNINGDGKGHWSDAFTWHLTQGQQALLGFAREQIALLDHELWYAHALLGDYGPQAKARAERELAGNSDERKDAA